jgi:chromosome partitioning protein
MNTPIITFLNNKGGVGKTTLVYHIAWQYAHMGKRVLAVDLDPQANLTSAFLTDERIEALWENPTPGSTIAECLKPAMGMGDIASPVLESIPSSSLIPSLHLLPGDVKLSGYEDAFGTCWTACLQNENLYRPLRLASAFWQIIQMAIKKCDADIVLVDVGPNLGAINRCALIATDYVVIPLGADLFSLQGLKNLGPALHRWRKEWTQRVRNWKSSSEKEDYPDFELPAGGMKPVGYLCQQPGTRLDRPVKAYDRWVQKIPSTYRTSILEQGDADNSQQTCDPNSLGIIKHYRSLVPMAQEHRKPIFDLTSSDGAIGSHANAVRDAGKDFEELATRILDRVSSS